MSDFAIRGDKWKHPNYLREAVMLTYDEYNNRGIEPGAEKWSNDSRFWRPQMVNDVVDCWRRLIDRDEMFPFHDDHVAQEWVSWRKLGREQKAEVREYFRKRDAAASAS
jgi:hypothetical protein